MVIDQYWKELFQLKTHISFIERKLEKAELVDRVFKIALALTSSASIGAWAIWQQASWVWAFIIALSQVVSAVVPFLPYRTRIKTYSSLLSELEEIMIHAERKWHGISDGKYTEEEINDFRFLIRADKQKALKKNIQTTIPVDPKIHAEAEESARVYLETFYS